MRLRFIYTLLFMPAMAMFASCGGENNNNTVDDKGSSSASSDKMTTRIPFKLLKIYPHNKTAYTEGLQYVDGYMYESTGQYGNSYIYKYELESGKIIKQYKLDDKYFGEGLTVLGDKMYMLTYRAQQGFVFDKNSFELLNTFAFSAQEGWGMTNDSTHLIYSDGTAALYFLDPETFKEVKRLTVTDNYGSVGNINELEYINGYIYANQWERDYILKINAETGKVEAEADLRMIRSQAGVAKNIHKDGEPEVMNGIAYDKATNRIFITGKNWDKMLEVRLDN